MAMNLPVELWMRVLELVRLEDTRHVHHLCNTTTRSVMEERRIIQRAPILHRIAWAKTKEFYQINRNSRSAAEKLGLTRLLLCSCEQQRLSYTF